jgi:hypothetical protein
MIDASWLHKKAWLGAYLKEGSIIYRIFGGKILLIIWSTIKAAPLSVYLLLELIELEWWLWLFLAIDVAIILVLYPIYAIMIKTQVKDRYADSIARQHIFILNTILGSIILSLVQFYTPHSDYRSLDWQQTIEYAATQNQSECIAFNNLIQLNSIKNALSWRAAQVVLPQIKSGFIWIAWILFLVSSVAFMWGFSRLMLGVLLEPNNVFST